MLKKNSSLSCYLNSHMSNEIFFEDFSDINLKDENIITEFLNDHEDKKFNDSLDTNVIHRKENSIKPNMIENINEIKTKIKNEKDINEHKEVDEKTLKQNFKAYNIKKTRKNEIDFINNINTKTNSNVSFLTQDSEEAISFSTATINEKNILNNYFSFVSTAYYKKIDNDENEEINEKNIDLTAEINNKLNPGTILMYRDFKSKLINENPNFINSINYFIQQPNEQNVSKCKDWFLKFADTFVEFKKNNKTFDYVNKNNGLTSNEIKFNTNSIIKKYQLIEFPPKIKEILRDINNIFNDIKKQLVLDEQTGFYGIIYEKINLPILCKHKYMTLNHENMITISKECAYKGLCKYCGDNIYDFNEAEINDLPTIVAELTYLLTNLTNSSGDDYVFISIYHLFSGIISKFVSDEDKKYVDKCGAIVSLYIYRIIKELISKNQIYEDSKYVQVILSRCAQLCASVGWDSIKLNHLLEDENLFSNLDKFIEILEKKNNKSNGYIENLYEIFKNYAIEELKTIKNIDKFNQLSEDFESDKFKLCVHKIDEEQITSSPEKILDILNESFDLFSKISSYYCPVNYLHKWENDKCIYCGLNKNNSNVDDVYQKNANNFTQHYDLKPTNTIKKYKYDNRKINLDKIINSNEDPYKILQSKLKLDEFEIINVKKNFYQVIEEVISKISYYTKENKQEIIKLDNEKMLKILIYLDLNGFEKNILNIFNYILLKPLIYVKNKKILED